MTALIIRKGNISDVSGIAAIEEACFPVPWSKESLKRDMETNPRAKYIVAEEEDKIVGYIGWWTIAEEAYINNIAVLPSHQEKSIGSILMKTMIHLSEAEGVKSHTLEVRAGHLKTQYFYEKFGFRSAGVRPGYYEDNGEDAVIMWRIGDIEEIGKES